jgi:hypothetical protein
MAADTELLAQQSGAVAFFQIQTHHLQPELKWVGGWSEVFPRRGPYVFVSVSWGTLLLIGILCFKLVSPLF